MQGNQKRPTARLPHDKQCLVQLGLSEEGLAVGRDIDMTEEGAPNGTLTHLQLKDIYTGACTINPTF